MKRLTRKTAFQLESLEHRRLFSVLTVSSAADSGAGSLRAQIAAAQSGDTINFAPSLAGQIITLTSGELAITRSLEIDGLGADRLVVSGHDQSRVFRITGSTTNVQIRNLTIADGYAFGVGGAIDFEGAALTVSNSTIFGNTVYSSAGPTYGGGIFVGAGTLSLSSSTLYNNTAVGGSYFYADPDCPYYPNCGNWFGQSGLGGALFVAAGATASVDHSTLAGNRAIGGYSTASPGYGIGAGIYNEAAQSALRFYDTIIADNNADVAPDLYASFTSLGHNLIGNASGGSGFAPTDLLNVNPQLGPLQNNGGRTLTMALLAGSPAINAGNNTNAPAYDQRGAGFPRIVGGTIDIGAFEFGNSTTKTWIGPASGGNWSTAANWSPGGVPTASDLVTISGKAVNLSASATVANLTLSGGATLNVAANGNRILRTSSLSIRQLQAEPERQRPDSRLRRRQSDRRLERLGVHRHHGPDPIRPHARRDVERRGRHRNGDAEGDRRPHHARRRRGGGRALPQRQ